MRVDHRRPHVYVPQEFLEQMHGQGRAIAGLAGLLKRASEAFCAPDILLGRPRGSFYRALPEGAGHNLPRPAPLLFGRKGEDGTV